MTFTDAPRGILPKAKNFDPSTDRSMNFSKYNDSLLKDALGENHAHRFHWLYIKAMRHPVETQCTYFEENGYEYEYRATWIPDTKVMVTNMSFCPNSAWHSGNTCPVCM